MNKVLLGIVMFMGVSASAGPLDLSSYTNLIPNQLDDIKTNSGIKVESAMVSYFTDWNSGGSWGSVVFPFAHLGSYLFAAGGYAHTAGTDPKGMALLGPGLKLNDLVRPLLLKGLKSIPKLNENAPLMSGLASAVSFGVMMGHDFNYQDKSNVVFNRVGYSVGLEYRYGKPASITGVTAQSVEERWSVR